ncbi:alpha-glucan family phosphorylase [Candidatus Peregrinibacteria bacterium]|nr:alpha-glucan family phosphorylase [Candidatus Peregrinibacteria bacterium]
MKKIAYFSMEFALHPDIPNFAGGLGVLATDIMSSCADRGVPAVGVSLIYHLSEDPKEAFDPSRFFTPLFKTVTVKIEDREVVVTAWKYEVKGRGGGVIPVIFLSTNLPENKRWDRDITKNLYPFDPYTRLCQEAILGIGGVRMLRALGYDDTGIFHMNEGHAAFLTLELLKKEGFDDEKVRSVCRFTTHTPIAAGHDRFDYKLAKQVLGDMLPWHIKKLATEEQLHMTRLALSLSGRSNAVSQKHKEVCGRMFPDHEFLGITNGVRHLTWVGEDMAKLYDKFLPGWRENPYLLAKAPSVPSADLLKARKAAKKKLADFINSAPECFPYRKETITEADHFDDKALTLTFSRRFVPYKRPLLLFRDLDRLREVGFRRLQIIYAGHCNPDDGFCNTVMGELTHFEKELRGQVKVAVLPHRDTEITKILAAGSDVWLNNPEPPLEASGTSGMKAALNGGLNLSVLDGWWAEAYQMDPKSGFAFGADVGGHDEIDAEELYRAIEEIIGLYGKDEWAERVKESIVLAAYFSTERCVTEYLEKMWD